MEIDVSFSSSRYLDVSVPWVPSIKLCIHLIVTDIFSAGFPHSEIAGSQDICSSPTLIAAYHVFLRLLVPRHPPYALYAWPSHLIAQAIWLNVESSLSYIFIKLIVLANLLHRESFAFEMTADLAIKFVLSSIALLDWSRFWIFRFVFL